MSSTTKSYTFDRRADPRRAKLSYTPPSHDEARLVMTQRAAQNSVLPEVRRVLERRQPRRPVQAALYDSKRWVGWLGQKIGEGAYGTAFRCQVSDEATYRALELVRAATSFWVEYRPVRQGGLVVIKITRADDRSRRVPQTVADRFALDNVREATLHKHLDEARCLNLGMGPLCVSQYVPDLHWAGLVINQPTGTRCFVTVMGVAPGIPVDKHLRRTRLDAEMFVRIERAAAALWAHGVVHADLHKDNMMYDAATKKLTIIDFGFGVLLPPEYTRAVRSQLARAVRAGVRSLGEMWLDRNKRASSKGFGLGIQRYVNRVQKGRGVPWYNPDGHAALMLYKRLPTSQRRLVPALRMRLWGVAPPTQATTPARSRRVLTQAMARAAAATAARRGQPGLLPRRRRRWLSWVPSVPFVWRRRTTPVAMYASPA